MRRHVGSRGDEGVALVMALVFMLVVGLFVGTALTKSQSVSVSGQQVRQRGQLQYALDGGVDRALQVLQDDLSTGSPSKCVAAPELETDITGFQDAATGLDLNGQKVSYSCQTLAGRAANTGDGTTTNYALLVTSPSSGALTTQSGVSGELVVAGSVYLNGQVANSDVKKAIEVSSGDIVSPLSRAGCAADLTALTDVTLTGTGQLKACTDQTLAQALPTITLPAAPTFVVSAVLGSGVTFNVGGGKKCRVFYPGRYSAAPALSTSDGNYFVSGLYYFAGIGQWQIDGGSDVIAGQRSVGTDFPSAPTGDCATMTDTTAMGSPLVAAVLASLTPNTFSYGATWVFGGSSSLDFKKGSVTMFTPPATGAEPAVNFVAASSSTGGGYADLTVPDVLTGGSNNSTMQLNAKLFAPEAGVNIFSTNNTVAAARGGVVAYTIDLQASAAGSDALAISAPGGIANPPPPFRTVRIVTRDKAGNSATNTAVATIGNFSPYPVSVKSWRTG